MEVYIEYVIIDNLIIDAIILYLTARLLKLHTQKGVIFLGAIIGTTAAILLPLITLNIYLLTLLKLLTGFLMIIILTKYSSVKEIIATFLVFITITFILGGVCYAIMLYMGKTPAAYNLIIFGYQTPVSIYIVIITLFTAVFSKIIGYIQHKSMVDNYIYKVKLTLNNHDFHLSAYLDTANELFDANNTPILLLSENIYKKILATTTLQTTSINVTTATTSQHLLLFPADAIEIKTTTATITPKATKCAVACTTFKNYDCLLNKAMFY